MAFDKSISEDYPVGTTHAMNVVDNDLRNLKYALRERAAIDHNRKADETGDSYIGYHKKVSLIDQASDASTYTQGGVFYTKAGLLYFRSSAGTVIQITAASQLVIGSNSHMISRGFELVYSSGTEVIVNPGTLYHNITQVNKTAATTLNTGTGSDYIDGSAPTITSSVLYIYCNSSGSIKFEETAPAYADTSGNTAGDKIYHLEGAAYWRVISAIAIDSADAIIPFQQVGNEMRFTDPYLDADLQVIDVTTSVGTFTAVDCSAIVPIFGRLISLQTLIGGTTENSLNINFRATGSGATNGIYLQLAQRTSAGTYWRGNVDEVPANATPSFDYKASFNTGDFDAWIYGYKMSIR